MTNVTALSRKVVQLSTSTEMIHRFFLCGRHTQWSWKTIPPQRVWWGDGGVRSMRSGARRDPSSIHNVLEKWTHQAYSSNMCLVSWEQTSCGNDSSAHGASEETWSLSSEESTQSAHNSIWQVRTTRSALVWTVRIRQNVLAAATAVLAYVELCDVRPLALWCRYHFHLHDLYGVWPCTVTGCHVAIWAGREQVKKLFAHSEPQGNPLLLSTTAYVCTHTHYSY